jgi:hypothetical protein
LAFRRITLAQANGIQLQLLHYGQAKKNMKYIIIILLILLSTIKTIACKCHTESLAALQDTSWKYSEYVFVGEVTWVNNDDIDSNYAYQVEVIEAFKGNIEKGDKIKGITNNSDCVLIPELGKWIIYAQVYDGYILLSVCALSRSFLEPFRYGTPVKEYYKTLANAKSRKQRIKVLEQIRVKALNDLEQELVKLRSNKQN